MKQVQLKNFNVLEATIKMKYLIHLDFQYSNVNSVSFDEAQSAEMAGLSFATYCQYSNIRSWTNLGSLSRTYPSYQNIQIFENTQSGNMGFIAYNSQNNQIVIVFRGSNNIQNWITNIQVFRTSFIFPCFCTVHSGMFGAYQNIKNQMNNLLNDYIKRYPQASIVLTGHSLGGGLATLAAAELAQNGRKVGIITFGQPRTGDDQFYNWYSQQSNILFSFRVVNEEDIVPHLPYQFLGFTHVGQEVWYQSGTKKICRQLKGEDPSCSFSVQGFSVEDHMTYTSLLKSGC
ncbi:hypothetical protein pb186bvf_020923 [Paramecium bursaria]